MPSVILSDRSRDSRETWNGSESIDSSKPPRQKGRGRSSTRRRSGSRARSEDRSSVSTSIATEASFQVDVSNGNISDSPDGGVSSKKSNKKSFGSFGNSLQKFVSSISTPSPNFRRRSQSVSRDDRKRGHIEKNDTTMTKSSTNGALDQSLPNNRSQVLAKLVESPNLIFPRGRTPGVLGIYNHGNTCFINAIIHCLSNTRFFVEYFLTGEFRQTKHQTAGSSRYRIGRLTESLHRLLQSLWLCRSDIVLENVSGRFKQVVGECASQYEGCTQNDAQEFLLWLLNQIHEEKQLTAEYRYSNQINGYRNGINNNNESSIVYDLFQAKYRSTLTCPSCGGQSKTYDPFLSVSLPIQQKHRVPVYVTLIGWTTGPKQIGLIMNTNDLIKDVREAIVERTSISEDKMLLVSLRHHTFHKTFSDLDPISDIGAKDVVYAVEIGSETEEVQSSTTQQTESVTILALNNTHNATYRKRVGHPFAVRVSRDATLNQLQMALLHGMKHMIKEASFHQVTNLFEMHVLDDMSDSYINKNDDLPLYAVCVDRAINQHRKGAGPTHVKVILEWVYRSYKSHMLNTTSDVEIDRSVKNVKAECQQTNMASLQDCLHSFTQQERLGSEDTWYCEKCRKSQHGTIKTLRLCSLPDVLIIHLKRFKQEGEHRTKLDTLIHFPIEGLDMSPAVEPDSDGNGSRDSGRQSMDGTLTANGSPGDMTLRDSTVYDLYAVCNHLGSMQDGHYTACCRNPVNNTWYMYDDTRVSRIECADKVVKSSAYLLFYQKRSALSRSSTSLKQWLTNEFSVVNTTNRANLHNATFADTDHSCDEADAPGYSNGSHQMSPRSILSSRNRNDTSYSSLKRPSSRSRTDPRFATTSDIIASSTPVLRRSEVGGYDDVDSNVGTSSDGLDGGQDNSYDPEPLRHKTRHPVVSFAPPPIVERSYHTIGKMPRRHRDVGFHDADYVARSHSYNWPKQRFPTHSNDPMAADLRKAAARARRHSNSTQVNQSFDRTSNRESRRMNNSVDTSQICTEVIAARPKQHNTSTISPTNGDTLTRIRPKRPVQENKYENDVDISRTEKPKVLEKPSVMETVDGKSVVERKPRTNLKFTAVESRTVDRQPTNGVDNNCPVGDLIDLSDSVESEAISKVSEHAFANGIVRVRLENSMSSSYTTYQYDIGQYVLQESSV